jgi:hypothetical protein
MNNINQNTQNNIIPLLEESENNISNAKLENTLKSKTLNKENTNKFIEERKEPIPFNKNHRDINEKKLFEEKKSHNDEKTNSASK